MRDISDLCDLVSIAAFIGTLLIWAAYLSGATP
jgi:hypothetical protein